MSQLSKSIAVAGTINKDTILTADGVATESYGGLLYSVLALAYIARSGTIIFPICNVGQDVAQVALSFLRESSSIRLDGVAVVSERNNHCMIRYDKDGNKEERLLGGVPSLSLEQFKPFLDCDALCLNFISGFELSLETLKGIRRSTDALIFMDVHSLTLGIDESGRRFFRKPHLWEEWLSQADIVQVNESEANLLADAELKGDREFLTFGERVLELGPSALLITCGDRGSLTVFRDESERVRLFQTQSYLFGPGVDQTGCGDVFLAGFVAEYLTSHDLVQASELANKAAGGNCCLRGIEEVKRIAEFVR